MGDWNPNTTEDTPDNAMILPKWTGDNSDRSLISLAQFLQEVATSDVDDVREVLSYYRQFDDPIEAFRENQRKLQDEMAANEEKLEEASKTQSSSLFSGLSAFRRR